MKEYLNPVIQEDDQLEDDTLTNVDRYGFIREKPVKVDKVALKLEKKRSAKWIKMLRDWQLPSSTHIEQKDSCPPKLEKRIHKGIPDSVRGEVWLRLLNIPTLIKEQEGKYTRMLDYGLKHSEDVRQIDLDVNRTYRDHIMFKQRYSTKQCMLFKILVAYSVYNSEIGYCQGMSQVAALLLMYMDEEDAFWALSTIMSDSKHAMHGFFIPGFPKLRRFSQHHDTIVSKLLPKLAKHLKKVGIESTLYTLKWYFQCFLDKVPFTLTLRLWDCFLYHGDIILIGMSYTLLKLHKKTLLSKKTLEGLINYLQVDLENDFGYKDDVVIIALFKSIKELKRKKLEYPDESGQNELPQKPFGINVSSSDLSKD